MRTTGEGSKRAQQEWLRRLPERQRFKERWSRWWWRFFYWLREIVGEWIRSLWTVEMVYSTMRALVVLLAGISFVTFGYHLLFNPHSTRKELPTTEEIMRLDHERPAKN